jgi:hypothetical protein
MKALFLKNIVRRAEIYALSKKSESAADKGTAR